MPNPRKPEALRTGHRTYPDSIQPSNLPVVAPPLSTNAKAVWDRILPIVLDLGVMTHADVDALGVLAELLAMHQESPNPKVAAQIRQYLSVFGLTPASRAAFAKQQPEKADPFADFDLG